MKHLIKLEELALFLIAVCGLYLQPLHFAWWIWILLFLMPDIGAVGYFINPRIGAITYNFFHHRFIGAAVLGIGYFTHSPYLLLSGLIILGHSFFDRIFGYGLKFPDDFKHTSLGWIGKNQDNKKT